MADETGNCCNFPEVSALSKLNILTSYAFKLELNKLCLGSGATQLSKTSLLEMWDAFLYLGNKIIDFYILQLDTKIM